MNNKQIDKMDIRIIEEIIVYDCGTIENLVYSLGDLTKNAVRKRLLKIGNKIEPVKYASEGMEAIKQHAVFLLLRFLKEK